MGSLIVLVIMAGCAAFMYIKGTFVKSFALMVVAICSNITAFAYFELLGNMILSKDEPNISPWAYTGSFLIIFVLSFAVFQAIASHILKNKVEMSNVVEIAGKIAFGLLAGLIISGSLLAGVSMSPLDSKTPYQRFDSGTPQPKKAKGVLFKADGFATGWFNLVSSKSFGGRTGFAAVHPDFISQNYLNRLGLTDKLPGYAKEGTIILRDKKSAWLAPNDLKDTDNQALENRGGYDLTMVRIGITSGGSSKFMLSQLSLVCSEAGTAKSTKSLTGKSEACYPIGFMRSEKQLQLAKLTEVVDLSQSKMKDKEEHGKGNYLDIAFYVPSGYEPAAVQYRQNITLLLPQTSEEVPPASTAYLPLPGQNDEKKDGDKDKQENNNVISDPNQKPDA